MKILKLSVLALIGIAANVLDAKAQSTSPVSGIIFIVGSIPVVYFLSEHVFKGKDGPSFIDGLFWKALVIVISWPLFVFFLNAVWDLGLPIFPWQLPQK